MLPGEQQHFFGYGGVLVVVGVAVLLWFGWRPLVQLVTEDSVLRCDRFFLQYWLFLQCCGLCDGEWTRCISRCCCCCVPSLVGRNLKRALGESLGLCPVPVKVTNITLGNLPRKRSVWFPGRPDIYVQITPDELQPIMRTETVSQANPTCVQFTTGLSLLIKNHVKENPVRFCVRELRGAGSSDVADCYISPTRLVAWARRGETVRVQLNACPEYEDRLQEPWILLRLGVPDEAPLLRTSNGTCTPVIATELVEAEGSVLSRDQPSSGVPFARGGSSSLVLPVALSKVYTTYPGSDEFKDDFPLLNERGARVVEPKQEILREVLRARGYIRYSFLALVALLVWYTTTRFYTMTCLEEYRQRHIIWNYANWNMTAPGQPLLAKRHKLPLRAKNWAYLKGACNLYDLDVSKFAVRVSLHTQALGLNGKLVAWNALCDQDIEENVKFCENYPQPMSDAYHRPRIFRFFPCYSVACTVDMHLGGRARMFLCITALWLASACCSWNLVQRRYYKALSKRTYTPDGGVLDTPTGAPASPTYF